MKKIKITNSFESSLFWSFIFCFVFEFVITLILITIDYSIVLGFLIGSIFCFITLFSSIYISKKTLKKHKRIFQVFTIFRFFIILLFQFTFLMMLIGLSVVYHHINFSNITFSQLLKPINIISYLVTIVYLPLGSVLMATVIIRKK